MHNVTADALPHAMDSVDLLSMSSVPHVVDEPLPVLAEMRGVLAPTGFLLLYDLLRPTCASPPHPSVIRPSLGVGLQPGGTLQHAS